MNRVDVAGLSVVGWLLGEHDYQFRKFDAAYGDEIKERRDFIHQSEIPDKWHRNTILRKGQSYMGANQQVLKVCAAARAVIVYDNCMDGSNRKDAGSTTFHKLFDHLRDLHEANLPPEEILSGDFENAFPCKKPGQLFLRAGELAMQAILSEQERTGKFVLPQPGLSSGNL